MSTNTIDTPVAPGTRSEYAVVPTSSGIGFTVLCNGQPLTTPNGSVRYFATANSARKRISRERRGNFHS